ncbi:phosphonate ABC transporter, permease protein PhnE [Peptoniphilus stercorisuis]|uniref:Phosphonate transport system permease protein n=1 Tax=Peptoniphilus stercorisuis TaxID=1436965 RepID=A0ABS4KC77_9FIRM|nr:phosphonate ABC transporter, permease protein PhnE [Peptoniphilus stercorisuis]MBP2025372.1 phosphonate transport system permease protein [Peptoniphilus stercorisuis]
MSEKVKKKLNEEPNSRAYIIVSSLIILAMLIWSLSAVQGRDTTGTGGLTIAKNIIRGIFNPDTALLLNFTKQGVIYMLLETICIAFLGTIIGAIISIPLSFLASSNIVPVPVSLATRFLIMMIRTIPSLIYGLMFIKVTGPGPFAGLLTMSFTSIGMLTKLFSDTIADLNKSILESLAALGCNTFEKIRYGVIPQLKPNFLSTTIYRFDMNLRDATTLGLVGAGGIGSPLIFAMNSYRWNQVGAILLGLIILVLLIEFFSTKIRTKLVRG